MNHFLLITTGGCIGLLLFILIWMRVQHKFLMALKACIDDLYEREGVLLKRIQRGEYGAVAKRMWRAEEKNKPNEEKE